MLAAEQQVPSISPLRALLVGRREENFFLIREILTRNGSPCEAELDHAASHRIPDFPSLCGHSRAPFRSCRSAFGTRPLRRKIRQALKENAAAAGA
jgi:hypothetical protein